MAEPARRRMTADEFIAWAMQQPEGEHYELAAGEIVGMAPERTAHARAKFRAARRLVEAVEAGGLDCEVFTDGMVVQVDAETIYEPDALVRCGPPLADDAVRVTDPVILVEVLSPGSRARDTGARLADYFRLASLRHYLIVRTEDGTVIHHARGEDGAIATRIVRGGPIRLDPPGIELAELLPAR